MPPSLSSYNPHTRRSASAPTRNFRDNPNHQSPQPTAPHPTQPITPGSTGLRVPHQAPSQPPRGLSGYRCGLARPLPGPPPISHLPATLDSKRSLVLLGTQPTTMRFEMRAGAGPALCTPPHPRLNANAPHHCPSHLPGGTEQPTWPLREKLTPAPPQPTLPNPDSYALQTRLDLSTPQTHFTLAQGRP